MSVINTFLLYPLNLKFTALNLLSQFENQCKPFFRNGSFMLFIRNLIVNQWYKRFNSVYFDKRRQRHRKLIFERNVSNKPSNTKAKKRIFKDFLHCTFFTALLSRFSFMVRHIFSVFCIFHFVRSQNFSC